MINRNELESQINTAVNANDNYFDADQISEIADEILSLDGFDLYKGDDVDSIDSDVFWALVEDIDDGTAPKTYTEAEWRA
jgi:hypothetical protein